RARKFLTIVDHVDAEADLVRHAAQEIADVAGAEDVHIRLGLNGLDEDLHLSAANQPGLFGEVVVELVLDVQGPARLDRLARLPEGVVLVASAADRADRPAVRVDEHLRPDALWRGARGRCNRDESDLFTALQSLRERRE